MTAQSLYNQLVQGTISKEKFLYEVRRDARLPFITRFNSLEDTITILKNKSVIKESKEVMPKYKADKNPELPEVESFTIDMVSPYQYSKGINYELGLTQIAVGQNLPSEEEMVKAQRKVLKNLTTSPYYYTIKTYSDEEKKYEKGNLRPEELKKDNHKAPNQFKKSTLKENHEQEGSCGCEHTDEVLQSLGLTESDLEDEDIYAEVNSILQGKYGMEEAVVLKDPAGNVQYAKDDNEATDITNNARTKGVQLTKTRV